MIVGRVRWNREGFGPGGPGVDWAGPDKAFLNNFFADPDDEAVEGGHFADPTWLDYRLQSDSPLRGKALGGGDRGAYRYPETQVYYVSPTGDDENSGTCAQAPFRTFRRANAALKPGDALYVMAGKYDEPLAVAASGRPGLPIHVRAYRKESFALQGIVLKGSHVTIQGFRVIGAPEDGVRVTGQGCRVERCLVASAGGAGLHAQAAADLTLNNCTFTGSAVGVALEDGSTNATVRNCILSHNRRAALQRDDASQAGYRGYNNCYFGAGLDRERIATEPDSLIADPGFATAVEGDCRLRSDSPAKYLAELGGAPGAEPALPRSPVISDVGVTADHPAAAVIQWRTPLDDTRCDLQYRRKGSTEWSVRRLPAQGTVHAEGLTYGLRSETTYEFQISAHGRRGGEATTDVATFRTPAKARPPATFHVAPDGDDRADGRSRATALRTLRKASVAVRPGDTVLVAPGVYHNTIRPAMGGTPDRRITFRSPTRGAALIDGAGALEYLVFLQHKSYVTIDGFRLDCGPTKSVGAPKLIQVNSCRGVEILNCHFGVPRSHVAQHAIGGGSDRELRIEGNVFWAARYHLRVGDYSDLLIKNNTFLWYSVYGISLGGSLKNARIVNNVFSHPKAGRGVYLHFRLKAHGGVTCDHNLYAPFESPECHVGRYEDLSTGIMKLMFPPARLERWR